MKSILRITGIACVALFFFGCFNGSIKKEQISNRWSVEKANTWWENIGWLSGCNFQPSTAINQLEMWQEDTFDPETIDLELGMAEELGFNMMRVYLHSYAWKQDPEGFKKRIDQCRGLQR